MRALGLLLVTLAIAGALVLRRYHLNAGLPNAFGDYDETPDIMAAEFREFAERGFKVLVLERGEMRAGAEYSIDRRQRDAEVDREHAEPGDGKPDQERSDQRGRQRIGGQRQAKLVRGLLTRCHFDLQGFLSGRDMRGNVLLQKGSRLSQLWI